MKEKCDFWGVLVFKIHFFLDHLQKYGIALFFLDRLTLQIITKNSLQYTKINVKFSMFGQIKLASRYL